MKLNNIVKILCIGLLPLPNTHRGRIDAGLFVREDYIFLYTAPTPQIFDCLERKGADICGILFYYF